MWQGLFELVVAKSRSCGAVRTEGRGDESQDPRVDACAVRIGRRQQDHGTVETGCLPSARRVRDEGASPGAVPNVQGARRRYVRYVNAPLRTDMGCTRLNG